MNLLPEASTYTASVTLHYFVPTTPLATPLVASYSATTTYGGQFFDIRRFFIPDIIAPAAA